MPTHPDHQPYLGFTKRQRMDKAIHTLEGITKGIAIDGRLNAAECGELDRWCQDHRALLGRHPFAEFVPKVQAAIMDGVISPEEQADILYLCRNLSSASLYYDAVTRDIQVLQGILHGILADGAITDEETHGLRDWVEANADLRGTYPFDELDSILTTVLRDGTVDSDEQTLLKEFFADFVSMPESPRREDPGRDVVRTQMRLRGVCAMCPDIEFTGRSFCFTGASTRAVRSEIAEKVARRRGTFVESVSQGLDYLVIGAAGNPCWAFSCYGRKVEEAVLMRRRGIKLVIVHEHDFWDAIADSGG